MISVIVPVYKVEDYLDQCVESIVNQTYKDLEIILVDDGSPDTCGDMCEAWKEKDERIVVYHQKNQGLSAARNTGIDHANGDYIVFLDSDDWMNPEMIEQLYYAICKNHADMAVCNFEYFYEDAAPEEEDDTYQIKEEMIMNGRDYFLAMHHEKYAVLEVPWNKMYSRKMFETRRYPKGKIHEDEFMAHRLFYSCDRISVIPYVGICYRQRSNSIMGSQNKKVIYHYIEAFLDRCIYFTKKNEPEITLYTEGRLLSSFKRFVSQNEETDLTSFKKNYKLLVKKMYKLKWIPLSTYIKRIYMINKL